MVRDEAKKEMEGLIKVHDDQVKVMREKHDQAIAQVCGSHEPTRQCTLVAFVINLFY